MTETSRWRWAHRLLWIAITLNLLFAARFALLLAICNLLGYGDAGSVIQLNTLNWAEYAFVGVMLPKQWPELLSLMVLCTCLIIVRRSYRHTVEI